MPGYKVIIGASLSEPTLAWLHCTCACVCLLACMLGPTTYRKSLPALILRGYVIRYIQRPLDSWRHEPWTV